MRARISGVGLAVALAAALSACGGGGGGGGTPAPPAPPVPAPPPPSFPEPMEPLQRPQYGTLELDETNAAEAVAIALRALEEVSNIATYATFIVDLQMQTGPRSFGLCPRVPLPPDSLVIAVFDLNADLKLSAGDVTRANFVPCTGVNGSLVMRVTLVDEAAKRFEARVEFSTDPTVEDGARGLFDLVTTFAGAPRVQSLSNVSIALQEEGQVTYLTAGHIEVEGAIADPLYSFSFEGDVASDTLQRSYRLATTALRGDRFTPPSAGEIVVEAGQARVRITPAANLDDRGDLADLAVDLTGSGTYGATTPLPWARMLRRDNLFGWFPNTIPRITRLEITPANPSRIDTLTPSYDVFDYDGDPVQVNARWSVNGARFPLPQPTLPPGSFVRGDEIELEISANDDAGGLGRRSITFTIGNAPPTATAAITPAAPLSIQDLALSWNGTDPDGDALTATYAWRVNDADVPGAIAASLSHTAHAKNDVVTGVAFISDGAATVAAEASVTIRDTPGTVAVPAPPAGVDFGDQVSFTAVASDYDGDDTSTRDFYVVYGPAGMTVHPDTGVVTWTAYGPMFEPTLRVNYGIGIDEPGSSVATGSFVVTDPNHAPPLARGGVSPPTANGLHVADLDGDGALETLVASDDGVYELRHASGGEYEQAWADFIAHGDTLSGVAAADVDGDGLAEIFVAYHDCTIVAYSGDERGVARRVTLEVTSTHSCLDFAVADLDGDGAHEVVVFAARQLAGAGGDALVLLAGDTLEVAAVLPPAEYADDLAVANVDDDAALEIVTASGHVYDGVAALGGSAQPEWLHAAGFGSPIAAGDVDGDGVAEIVGVQRVQPIPGLVGSVRAFDARTQTHRWSAAVENPGRLHVADVTGDATAEILVGHDLVGDVTVLQQTGPAAAAELLTLELGDTASVNALATGDFDGDTDVEIVAGGVSNAWFVVAHGGATPAIEWSRADTVQPFGFLGGAALGDELAFLAGASDGSMRFARFDVGSGAIALGGEVGTYSDLDAAFAVVDYDDDGVHEALLAAEDENNVATELLAYDATADAVEWSVTAALDGGGPTDVAYADFTGDGRDELVVLTKSGGLYIFEVGASAPLYLRPGTAGTAGTAGDVAVTDLDGDGELEIVATIDQRVAMLARTATGFEVTGTSAQFSGLRALEITDIDGDAASDVFVLYGDPNEPARLARLDRFLLQRGDVTLADRASDMTTERSGFARKNLVFWRKDFRSDVFAADPFSGTEVWRAPRFFGFIEHDSVRYHDFGGAGDWSIAVGAAPGVTLTRPTP